jgi:2,4-dienoyl-CoA reductase (NADPH2)
MTAMAAPSRHERFLFRNAEALLKKAADLGLTLPFREDISILFDKPSIAGRTLAGRLAVQPMEGADAEADGSPGPLTFRRYERFGAGGCGCIWFEAAAVRREGRSNPRQLLLTKDTLDGFKRLVERTRNAAADAGTTPPPLLILQLTHSGRFSKPEGTALPILARHDPRLDGLLALPHDSPLIPDEALDRLQDDFRRTAGLAEQAGFDGIDIKACHGYLAGELLAARDRNSSRYGGSFENRSRFLLETLRGIRSESSRMILACRLGVYDGIPGGFGVDAGDPAREDLDEPAALVRTLLDQGLSLLNVTAGIPAYRAHIGRPFDKPAAKGAVPDEHPLEGVARLLRLTASIQHRFPTLPVIGTGYSWLRRFFPAAAAGALYEHGATLVGLGRLAFACPDFARILREQGRLDSKRVCLACSSCSTLLRAGRPAGCVVRDASRYRLP